MPNWCENRLDIIANTADELKTVLEKVIRINDLNKEGYQYNDFILDFELLLPMPKELNIDVNSFIDNTVELLKLPADLQVANIALPNPIHHSLSTLARDNKLMTIGEYIQWLEQNSDKQQQFGFNLLFGRQYLENIEKYGVGNWYDWRYKNWGVKWNATTQYCPDYDINHTEFSIDFDTPWCAPEAWFKTLIDTFPNVTFKLTYFEPDMFFGGICSSVESENCYYQYPESTSEVKILAKEFGYEDEDWHCDNE